MHREALLVEPHIVRIIAIVQFPDRQNRMSIGLRDLERIAGKRRDGFCFGFAI